jgi:hypothetical protein
VDMNILNTTLYWLVSFIVFATDDDPTGPKHVV